MSHLAVAQTKSTPIFPGAWLGILGGGQLGRMFCHAAQQMGYRTLVLDPDPDSPAGLIAHRHVQANYDDASALQLLADTCAAIGTEFENVPAHSLALLARSVQVAPSAHSTSIAQDRALEKQYFSECGIATAPYLVITRTEDLQGVAPSFFPGILKTTRLGYDGKGQHTVHSAAELAKAWDDLQQQACVLEKRLPLAYEISVIVARAHDGAIVHLPVQRNLHRNGVLACTRIDQEAVPPAIAHAALQAAQATAEQLQYVGVLCLEFFVLTDGSLIANEMAPRPHNSGHYSIEACSASQFELQIRSLCRLPLVQPVLYTPAAMLNLLGDLWWLEDKQTLQSPAWDRVLALPGVHLHLYGKTLAKAGRKMGHITLTAPTIAEVASLQKKVETLLGLPSVNG